MQQTFTKANLQTKAWRKVQTWYRGGKRNECENNQCSQLATMFSQELVKTNLRLNFRTHTLAEKAKLDKTVDCYDWSETFDRKVVQDNTMYLFNLKFVCDTGGAQKRTLQLVNFFVDAQYQYLVKNKETDIVFVNVLDGDFCAKQGDKWLYLKSLYPNQDRVFVGDMVEFKEWFGQRQSIC